MGTIFSRAEVWIVAAAAAAFLVLYWALRGAPIGQAAEEEGEDAPRSGYRDRVIAAVCFGLISILAGGYVALARSVPWSIPLFAGGFAILLALINANRRYRHASPALRRTVDSANTALTATLLAGILLVINVLAFRYGGRAIDFTRERAFSLSPLTIRQLRSLDRPVAFTLLYGGGERAGILSERVGLLLDLYKAANPRMVRVERLNPFVEFPKFESLAKRIPDIAVIPDGGVLIEYGEAENPPHAVVRNNNLFNMPRSLRSEDRTVLFETQFHGEDALTSALIGLREEKKPKIAFTTGHGEPSINNADVRRPDIGVWKSRLTATGSDAIELNLIKDEIPTDTALVIVVAPKNPFRPEEAARLKAYSDRGGPLLVIAGNQTKTGLEDLLKSFNLEIGPGLVVDRFLCYARRPDYVYIPITEKLHHPIVDTLANRVVLFPLAAPLRVLGVGGSVKANRELVATPILRSGERSWAELDLSNPRAEFTPNKDERGPLTVGAAVADRPKPGADGDGRPRLVVFSSPGMALNGFVDLYETTNLDLLMNSIAWLRGRSDLQGITPKTHVALTLSVDDALRQRLILVPTVMAVLLIIGLGMTTYISRRQ